MKSMKTLPNAEWISCPLGVNGIEFGGVYRRALGDSGDFEVVIAHRILGSFSVYEGFLLEAHELGAIAGGWRQVSFGKLKAVFEERPRTAEQQSVYRHAVINHSDRTSHLLADPAEGEAGGFARTPVEGDDQHIARVQVVLDFARIRNRIVGGLSSRGRCWGHVSFLVRSLFGARMQLLRAGFLPAHESNYVFIDPQNGWKINFQEQPNVR